MQLAVSDPDDLRTSPRRPTSNSTQKNPTDSSDLKSISPLRSQIFRSSDLRSVPAISRSTVRLRPSSRSHLPKYSIPKNPTQICRAPLYHTRSTRATITRSNNLKPPEPAASKIQGRTLLFFRSYCGHCLSYANIRRSLVTCRTRHPQRKGLGHGAGSACGDCTSLPFTFAMMDAAAMT